MQDLQTKSLWSQVTGEAIRGPMEGAHLTPIPAIHTTFAAFAEMYPDGVLLRKPAKGPGGSGYASYFADKTRLGVFGRPNNFEKLDGKDLVYGLRLGSHEVAISADYVRKNEYAVVHDSTRGPVVVTFEVGSSTVAAFLIDVNLPLKRESITVEDNKLKLIERFARNETAVVWDARTGTPLKETKKNLEQVPVITAYWFAWVSFFPETGLVD